MSLSLLRSYARPALLSRVAIAANSSKAAVGVRAKHTLPDLQYDYGALEPAISAKIMEVSFDVSTPYG